jgi:hypothetical protein
VARYQGPAVRFGDSMVVSSLTRTWDLRVASQRYYCIDLPNWTPCLTNSPVSRDPPRASEILQAHQICPGRDLEFGFLACTEQIEIIVQFPQCLQS